MRLGEDDGSAGVLQHEGQPLGGVGRVEREVGSTGLEGGEDGDSHVEALVEAQAHGATGGHVQRDEVVSQLVGARVELRVGERVGAIRDGHRVRGACGLGLDGTVHGHGRVRLARGVVPLQQQLALLDLAQHRQAPQRLACVGRDRREQPLEVVPHAPRRRLIEEVGVVLDGAVKLVAGVRHHQGQVELGGSTGCRHGPQLQGAFDCVAITPRRVPRRVLQGEQDLEEWSAAQVPLGAQLVDQLLEGHVLVGVRIER